jgi:hypothetical protein
MILGLDISTSCTGFAVLSELGELKELGHIDFKGCDDFWDKVDAATKVIRRLIEQHRPSRVFVEESLQAFRPGLSSANTLLTLAKFNGILSNELRIATARRVDYIASGAARRTCGIKLVQLKKHPKGLSHKEQTFEYVTSTFLASHVWPEKKGADPTSPLVKRVVSASMDETDAYVIALAGLRSMNTGAESSMIEPKCSLRQKKSLSSKGSSVKEARLETKRT